MSRRMQDQETEERGSLARIEAHNRDHESREEPRSLLAALPRLIVPALGVVFSLRGFRNADTRPGKPQPADGAARSRQDGGARRSASVPARGKAETRRASSTAAGKKTASQAADAKAGPQWLVLGKELYARFNRDEDMTRAAALAFAGVLSLIPVLLFALAILGFFIRDPQQAATYVQKMATQFLPGQQASQAASQVIAQTHIVDSARGLMNGKWWAAAFGFVSLLLTTVSLLVAAAAAMNAAWEVKETRSFIKLRLVCLGVLAGAGVLFLLSLLPSSGPNVIRNLHISWLGLPKHVPLIVTALFELLAVALNVAMFTFIYRFLPNAKVTWKAALFGGVIVGVLWELFKKGFALYLTHFGNYNKLYGTLGGIILLVTWIYYSCIILLLGATLGKMYHEHKEEGGVVLHQHENDAEPQTAPT